MAAAKNNDNALEEAFRLIKEGNEQDKEKDFWLAADSYSQAQGILHRLASEQDVSDEEQQQISKLYLQKSAEYLHLARGSLISVLKKEADEDSNSNGGEGVGTTSRNVSLLLDKLTEEESLQRMKIFGRLFATEPEDLKSVQEQESAMEARLRQLNDSLPSSMKTEKERVRDLNMGLRRLGLSIVPDGSEPQHKPFGIDPASLVPKSEVDQVDDIIAQAKDEVAIAGDPVTNETELAEKAAAGTLDIADGAADVLVDEDDSLDEGDDVSSDGDADLTPEICKDIQDKIADAQLSLSELMALFDADGEGNAEIEFSQARGKKLLRDSRVVLREIADKWSSC